MYIATFLSTTYAANHYSSLVDIIKLILTKLESLILLIFKIILCEWVHFGRAPNLGARGGRERTPYSSFSKCWWFQTSWQASRG